MFIQPLKKQKVLKVALLIGFIFFLVPTFLQAQQYPTKQINVMAGGAAGGPGDIPNRLLFGKAEKILGQSFAITNNSAAGGTVALSLVAKERPDGYHLGACISTQLLWLPYTVPVTYKLEDFVPIMHFGFLNTGVAVKTDSPWKTFKELVDYAKKNPEKITYAVTGAGNPMDLAMKYVAKVEGIQWTGVPTPGGDPNTLLLGGHVNVISMTTTWIPHVKSGALRPLAVHCEKRLKALPEVPTFRELGYDFVHEGAMMFCVPKGTPLPIVKTLDDALRKAMEDNKDLLDYMEKMSMEVGYRNHEDLKKYLEENKDRVARIIEKLGLSKEPGKK